MTTRSMTAAIVVLCLAVASCSDSNSKAPADERADTEAGSDAEQAENAAGTAAEGASGDDLADSSAVGGTATALNEVNAFLRQWNSGDRQEVAQCMYDAGFPQMIELAELDARSEAGRSSASSRLTIFPHEMGPYTESQAREFGVLGPLWRSPEVSVQSGQVVTTDPAYNATHQACVDESRGQYDQDYAALVRSLSAASHDLSTAITSQFRALIDSSSDLATLIDDRFACVRDSGYPELDLDELGGSGSWELILSQLGIEEGERDETELRDSNSILLDPGEVAPLMTEVIPGAEAQSQNSYIPSAGEVEFALAFVECGEQVDFLERLEQLQIPIRAAVLAEFETQILGLRERALELAGEG